TLRQQEPANMGRVETEPGQKLGNRGSNALRENPVQGRVLAIFKGGLLIMGDEKGFHGADVFGESAESKGGKATGSFFQKQGGSGFLDAEQMVGPGLGVVFHFGSEDQGAGIFAGVNELAGQ